MSKIIELLNTMLDFIGSNGRKEEEILSAENTLCVNFSSDYREYLKEIGLACYDGHELTGITHQTRLDVVSVTLNARKNTADTECLYVIEETNIDGIIIWQSSTGAIFQTSYNSRPVEIAKSLYDYISNNC